MLFVSAKSRHSFFTWHLSQIARASRILMWLIDISSMSIKNSSVISPRHSALFCQPKLLSLSSRMKLSRRLISVGSTESILPHPTTICQPVGLSAHRAVVLVCRFPFVYRSTLHSFCGEVASGLHSASTGRYLKGASWLPCE